uniref:Uncharacterized protein n=1 Tax=Anguilla anguilla TaxID=7936 RepID=A0A0E9TRN8_ANGAN
MRTPMPTYFRVLGLQTVTLLQKQSKNKETTTIQHDKNIFES